VNRGSESDEPTLARRLGDVSHVSPLWRKVREVSGCPEDRIPEWLLKCAVSRGAAHYERPFEPDLPSDNTALSDEEIAVALCLGQHPYNSAFIRAAAQLLSSERIDAARVARLAKMERVDATLAHIASVAEKFAPDSQPWADLRRLLRPRGTYKLDALPHWSRFVSQTGVTAGGGAPSIQWLRRREPKA
jgi:hypothetical protein